MDDTVLHRVGQAFLTDHPTPWWLDGSYQLSDLLAHPSRALAVFTKPELPGDALTRAAFAELTFPYDSGNVDGIVLLGPRFAVTYAMRGVDPRREPRYFYNEVEQSDSDATVQVALGLWDRSGGTGSPFHLLEQAFDTARHVTAPV